MSLAATPTLSAATPMPCDLAMVTYVCILEASAVVHGLAHFEHTLQSEHSKLL